MYEFAQCIRVPFRFFSYLKGDISKGCEDAIAAAWQKLSGGADQISLERFAHCFKAD
jgi:hypothetical protein